MNADEQRAPVVGTGGRAELGKKTLVADVSEHGGNEREILALNCANSTKLSPLPTVKFMCSVNHVGFQNNDGGARYQLDSTIVDGERGNF